MQYELKREPEDFVVSEELRRSLTGDGDHLVLRVTKRLYNTEDMVEALATHTPYGRHRFSYAGNKDRRAITTQHVTVKHGDAQHFDDIPDDDLRVEIAGWSDAPLSLGDLAGNHFTIRVRGADSEDVAHRENVVNYFGDQRFSDTNHVVGERIVRSDYEGAADILGDDDHHGHVIQSHLSDHENDYTTALRQLPDNLLQLFVHAYQSQLWNRAVQEHREAFTPSDDFPIIGFGTEPETRLERRIIRSILEEESLSRRDFIIRGIPELSAEGTRRDVFTAIQDFSVTTDDNHVQLDFYLDKGSYATVAVGQIIGDFDPTN